MAFLTGLLLIDAPASALNNAGRAEEARTENAIAVKFIRSRQGAFPYVSAQAFRYWLRTTLEQTPEFKWKAAPIFRETKIAYTDANPLDYWDDDLFGYMRAPSKKGWCRRKAEGRCRTCRRNTHKYGNHARLAISCEHSPIDCACIGHGRFRNHDPA